jgi:hypothetical protein
VASGAPRAAPLAFSYHRALAPMLWAFVALGVLELFVVHLLLALLWSVTAALIATLLTLATLAWLIGFIRSIKRLPVTLDDAEIVLRMGNLIEIRVARDNVAGLRTSWPSGLLSERGVLDLALVNQPNVVVELKEPVLWRPGRQVAGVAHRLDDPSGFAAALAKEP